MMDAVKYLKTLRRMCNCECCSQCELGKRLIVYETCTAWRKAHPDEAVAIVEQWDAEHPVKTRQSEFLKLFPNAQTDSGCLNACPMDVFGNTGIDCNKRTCFECKKAFWLAEVEDA
jgi:(2Fe-2S) ferredoxin